jgi:predicted DNA-binding transcriptional regulator YafY
MKNRKTESRAQTPAAKTRFSSIGTKRKGETRIPRITTERQRTRMSDGRSVKRNTWERMYRIYGWLKSGEYPNCGRVVAEFEVERKTALRDIAFMQDWMEMPIAYDDLRHGYYFDGPAPEFGPVALSERDLFGLCFMGKALEQFRGTTVGRPLEALLSRVSRQLDDGERFTLQNLEDVMSVRPLAAEDGDVPLFELVSRGVGQRRVLKFQYRKPGGGSRVRMRLSGLEEIEQHVLSWGNHASVMEPRELRERLGAVARALAARYADAGMGNPKSDRNPE